jgi:hypothetical protein
MSFAPPLSNGATTYVCSIWAQTRTQSVNPWQRWDSITNLFVCILCTEKIDTESHGRAGHAVGDRLSSGHPATYNNPGSPAPSNPVPGNRLNTDGSHALSLSNEAGVPGTVVQSTPDPTSKAVDLVNA